MEQRRGGRRPCHSAQPTIIPEEPIHEIYANLVGINRTVSTKAYQPERSSSRTTTVVSSRNMHHLNPASSGHDSAPSLPLPLPPSLNVIQSIEEDSFNDSKVKCNKNTKKNDEFSKMYRRALSDPPALSDLALDKTNKGFKMLSKMGWREHEGGLGRKRQGSMLPIKTTYKNDKRGLGIKSSRKARITHNSSSPTAAKGDNDYKAETKAERRARKRREAEDESRQAKRIRMLLRTDVSDEYEKLYVKLHSD